MARISFDPDYIRHLEARLRASLERDSAELLPLLAELFDLQSEWRGGRSPVMQEALEAARRHHQALAGALEELASYLSRASDMYASIDSEVRGSIGPSPDIGDIQPCSLDDLLSRYTGSRNAWSSLSWPSSREPLEIPLGISSKSEIVALEIGPIRPNVVVAGGTGSGKSEFLRSCVLSIAALNAPRDAALVLVDGKGGGAFGGLNRLPHVVSVVSSLTEASLSRLMVQLRAAALLDVQPKKRESSRLILVIDEVAQIESELPSFFYDVRAVVRASRIPVHLILASQRSDSLGVVDHLTRQATRIAFSLPSAGQSRDFLGSPAAASIRRSQPGVAIVATDDGHRTFRAARAPDVGNAEDQVVESLLLRDGGGSARWPPPLPVRLTPASIQPMPQSNGQLASIRHVETVKS